MSLTLILGGARSGKTRHALRAAEAHDGPLTMIATAEAFDGEMAERIARHQAERGQRWRTVEAPLGLAAAIRAAPGDQTVVVDCLTLWLSNLMHAERDIEAATVDLLQALASAPPTYLISNEVGWGIVPDNALARRFRDEAGRMHQRIAEKADRVILVVAGLPMVLKSPS